VDSHLCGNDTGIRSVTKQTEVAIPDYTYITQAEERDEAITQLETCSVIGVDTEGDSLYSYQEKVCLIQISGDDHHYIFDPLLLDSLEPLAPLFSNPSILKIFHGADYDIVSLKRDYQFKIESIFYTALAARAVGIKQFSLQSLIQQYFQVMLVKKYQKADWSFRPLTKEHLDYASLDTVYLDRLYQILNKAVQEKGRSDQLEEECALLQKMCWNGKPFNPNIYLRIKGARVLSVGEQKVLRELVTVRDQLAKERNTPPFKVISSSILIEMAKAHPEDEDAMNRLLPKKNRTVTKHLPMWLSGISKGLSSQVPLPEKEKRSGPPMTADLEKILKSLKLWRNTLAEAEGLEPAMILTGNVLTEIIRQNPGSIEDLKAIPLLRAWQVRRYGEGLLQEIAKAKNSLKTLKKANLSN